MARLLSQKRVLFCCLAVFTIYLLTSYHNLTLGLSVSWSGSAVRRVKSWDGHRQLSLLVVVPSACGEDLASGSEQRCLQHIGRVCRDFPSRSCITKKGLGQSDACDATLQQQRGSSDVKNALLTPFRRVLPALKELGWTRQQISQDSSPSLGSAIRHADIVICSMQTYQKYSRTNTHFVTIDDSLTGNLGSVDPAVLQQPQVLAVLKPHVVTIPSQRREQMHRPLAGPQKKVHALIPLLWLWAFPLDCGSSLNYLRFTGFFQPQLASWERSELWQRPVDVVLLATDAVKDSPGYAHHRLAALELVRLKQQQPHLKIVTLPASNYDEYLNTQLMDAKVVVSVIQPSSEVSLQDYEAWLAGCVLVKPRAPDIQAYPHLIQAGYTVYDVNVDFSNLGEVVQHALNSLDKSQGMVERVTAMLKKHSDVAQFAIDLDELLELSIKESMSLE